MTPPTHSTDGRCGAEATAVAPQPKLPPMLVALVARIHDPEEARAAREVLAALHGLLCDLKRLGVEEGAAPACVAPAARSDVPEADAVFGAVRRGALALVERVESVGAGVRAGGELAGALGGVAFAVRHELRSVFGDEPEGSTPRVASDPSKVAHAHGLLRNCFQQCTLLVVRAFEPSADEAELFDDGRVRLRQTLLLRDALASLIRSVGEAERRRYPRSAVGLAEEVERFRRESLGYLMRKDWATFESLAAEVVGARADAAFRVAARRFHAYVETLLAHVQMRAVLVQHNPAPAPATPARPFARAFRAPAAWTAAAACVLVALALFVVPNLSAKGRADEQKTEAVAGARVEVEAVTAASVDAAKAADVDASAAEAEGPEPRATLAAAALAQPDAAAGRAVRGRVLIQLGAYGSESAAAEQAARLKGSGVEAFVTRAQAAAGGLVFRVQAGPFESREAAALAGRRLQEKGAVRSFVIAERG